MSKSMGHQGIKHHMARVPFRQIEVMRTLHAEGMRICDIARLYNQKPDQVRQWVDMRTRCES